MTGDRGYPYVPAKYQLAGRAGQNVIWVVIHTMESNERLDTAEAVGRYFQNPPRVGSSHYGIDADSIVQYVLERNQAAGAAGANKRGIHLEHAGCANQTAIQWADDYSARTLRRSAGLCAAICRDYKIPPTWLSVSALKAGNRGIVSHDTVSRAFGGTHWDPGPNFPIDHYLQLVRVAMAGQTDTSPVPSTLVPIKLVINGSDQTQRVPSWLKDGNTTVGTYRALWDYFGWPEPVWKDGTLYLTTPAGMAPTEEAGP